MASHAPDTATVVAKLQVKSQLRSPQDKYKVVSDWKIFKMCYITNSDSNFDGTEPIVQKEISGYIQ